MDIFKFTNPTDPLLMQYGQIINGFTSKMWIERYRDAGEFTLVAPISTGIRDLLPIGTYISHTDTDEIMVVENHEIQDDKGTASSVTITGRSFETILENRVIGENEAFPKFAPFVEYALPADHIWNQAIKMIGEHILPNLVLDPGVAIPWVQIISTVSSVSGSSVARTVPRESVYKALMDLLTIENIGIRTIRPGAWSTNSNQTTFDIHNGTDRSGTVAFSHDTGEVITSDYLWSNKNSRNGALVRGTWVEVLVRPTETGAARRTLYVDGSDIDKAFTTMPSGTDYTNVAAALRQRGVDTIASLNEIVLTRAEIDKTHVKAIYRSDYELGDVVTVHGDYNENAKMQVTEYVEAEDSSGETGYPTLVNV